MEEPKKFANKTFSVKIEVEDPTGKISFETIAAAKQAIQDKFPKAQPYQIKLALDLETEEWDRYGETTYPTATLCYSYVETNSNYDEDLLKYHEFKVEELKKKLAWEKEKKSQTDKHKVAADARREYYIKSQAERIERR